MLSIFVVAFVALLAVAVFATNPVMLFISLLAMVLLACLLGCFWIYGYFFPSQRLLPDSWYKKPKV